jgi:hypothetical protein
MTDANTAVAVPHTFFTHITAEPTAVGRALVGCGGNIRAA